MTLPLRSLAFVAVVVLVLAAPFPSYLCSAFVPPRTTPGSIRSSHGGDVAFVPAAGAPPSASRRRDSSPCPVATTTLLRAEDGEDQEEKAIECYITNEEEVLTEGEKPEVVCTSEPEEYAWMEGIDPEKLVKTDGVEGMTECVEGASPKGTPEWKCE